MRAEDLGLTPESFDPSGALRALHRLETDLMPKLRGAAPYWSPKPPAVWKNIHEPDWSWTSPDREFYTDAICTRLDCNGAFLAPLSGTPLAHGELQHTGALARLDTKRVLPGYYQITAAPWQYEGLVSPLGDGPAGGLVTVAAPTLQLLLELRDQDAWPEVEVHDSWVSAKVTRLSAWAAWLRDVRLFAMDTDAQWELEGAEPTAALAVKDGYSIAIQLMVQESRPGAPRKSKVRRPDWYHSIRSAHKANTWRKAWKATNAGIPVLSMGNVDEIEIPSNMVRELIDMDKPPIRIDLTGRQLGAFKVKR